VSWAGWDNEAWEQIRDDYERYWGPFDARFQFRPGMDPATWPAIKEPPGSVTVDLGPIFANQGERGFEADEAWLNDFIVGAFANVFPDGTRLLVLDWQHTSYWFRPHRQQVIDEPLRVEPFPNGDYHIFLTEDMSQGTFGHPWEQTLCVFGADLVPAIIPSLTEWLPVKRPSVED
jgi:hypothetical protein